MENSIKGIFAEICIVADSEKAAREVATRQLIGHTQCKWSRDYEGLGGKLYLNAELHFDSKQNHFTLHKPAS